MAQWLYERFNEKEAMIKAFNTTHVLGASNASETYTQPLGVASWLYVAFWLGLLALVLLALPRQVLLGIGAVVVVIVAAAYIINECAARCVSVFVTYSLGNLADGRKPLRRLRREKRLLL